MIQMVPFQLCGGRQIRPISWGAFLRDMYSVLVDYHYLAYLFLVRFDYEYIWNFEQVLHFVTDESPYSRTVSRQFSSLWEMGVVNAGYLVGIDGQPTRATCLSVCRAHKIGSILDRTQHSELCFGLWGSERMLAPLGEVLRDFIGVCRCVL